MARHRVIDIRRLGGAGVGSEHPAAGELAWLGGIVEVVTACGIVSRWERAIVRCDEPSCTSALALRRTGDACEWYCPSCATFGAVVGWRGSHWDLSEALQNDESDRTEAAIFTRIDELESVRRCALSQPLKLTLALAVLQADYVVVTCAERELSELLCALEDASARVSAGERRLIDRFVARVDSALLACEARVDVSPTLH